MSRASVLVLLLMVPSATARADPRVPVVVASSDAERAEVEALLGDLLSGLPVHVIVEPAERVDADELLRPDPAAAPALARVWIDLAGDERATVYVVDSAWERALVRHVALGPSGVDEVVREQVGRIVSSSVEAMLAGSAIGLERVAMRRELGLPDPPPSSAPGQRSPAPVAPITDSPRQRARLRVGLGYVLWLFDPTLPTHGLTGSVGAGLRVDDTWLSLSVAGAYRFAATHEGADVGATFEFGGVRLEGTLGWDAASWAELGVGVSGLLSIVSVVPVEGTADAAVRPSAPSWRVDPSLGALLYALLRPLDELWIAARVGLDIDLVGARYTVAYGSRRETAFRPSQARLRFEVALGFDVTL